MAYQLSNVRTNFRLLINDTTSASYQVSDSRANYFISNAYLDVGSILGLADTWAVNAVTLVSGTSDYALSASITDF